MEILQLDGLEPQLFNLIGPLAMNPKVLRANNNYPFKTTERFQWYIAVEDNDVTGFVPVEQKSGGYVINNYYVHNDDQEVLVELLGAVKPKNNLYAIVQTKHEAIFSNCGFQTEHRWTNYIKMIYNTNKMNNKRTKGENVYQLVQKRLKFYSTNLIISMFLFLEEKIAVSCSTYVFNISESIIWTGKSEYTTWTMKHSIK